MNEVNKFEKYAWKCFHHLKRVQEAQQHIWDTPVCRLHPWARLFRGELMRYGKLTSDGATLLLVLAVWLDLVTYPQ